MFHNANDYRTLYPDVAAALPQYCAPRLQDGYEIETARRRIALRAGPAAAAAPSNSSLRGYVDSISTSRIEGWAQNTDRPEVPVCLDIRADGRLIGQVLANRFRDDLRRAGLGSGHHAFSFTLLARLAHYAGAIEIRRSLDGGKLILSAAAQRELQQCQMLHPVIKVHRRAAGR
jgi:hypothetical protein